MGGDRQLAIELVPPLEIVLDSVELHAVQADQFSVLGLMEIDDLLAFDLVMPIDVLYYFILFVTDGY